VLDINGWELIVLVIVAVVVLGPERLPEYAAKLGRLVREVRLMAEGARSQLKEQLGPEFDDLDWRQYDPRQYDPRRIVREALMDPDPAVTTDAAPAVPPAVAAHDPDRPTPFDPDAT
jgi:sec-independent protein translocase protein TatB